MFGENSSTHTGDIVDSLGCIHAMTEAWTEACKTASGAYFTGRWMLKN